MGGIFISYRRSDVSGYAHALYAQLTRRFGTDQIFMDIDSIEPGTDFVEVIEKTLDSASVALVLIGRRWYQPERLQDPMDFVRLEISMALERRMRVIPVCFESTPMPKPEELPEAIRAITRRQAVDVSDLRFNYDVGRLIDFLARSVGQPPPTIKTLPPDKPVSKATEDKSKLTQSTKDASSYIDLAAQLKIPELPGVDIFKEDLQATPAEEERPDESSKIWIKKKWITQKASQEGSKIIGLFFIILVGIDIALSAIKLTTDQIGIAVGINLFGFLGSLIYALVVIIRTMNRVEDGRWAVKTFRAGKWTEAEKAVRWLISHGRLSFHAWAYGILGTLYSRAGNYADAEDAFNRSIRLGLDEDWVRRNREVNAGLFNASQTENSVGAVSQEAQ